MRNLLLLSALAVAGCSGAAATPKVEPAGAESPKSDRFRPGQAGMVSGAEYTQVRSPDGREWNDRDPEFVDCFAAEGDRFVVLADDRDPEGEGRKAVRWVKVRMETGSRAGKSYLIQRFHVIATP